MTFLVVFNIFSKHLKGTRHGVLLSARLSGAMMNAVHPTAAKQIAHILNW